METNSLQFLPRLAKPISKEEAQALPPMSLAFIGDSVHSLFVRSRVTIGSDKQTGELHKEVTKEVCAVNQAFIAEKLLPLLNKAEADIFRRARNSRIHTTAKHAEISQYRRASGFEAVLGYLYLVGDEERLADFLERATVATEQAEAQAEAQFQAQAKFQAEAQAKAEAEELVKAEELAKAEAQAKAEGEGLAQDVVLLQNHPENQNHAGNLAQAETQTQNSINPDKENL